MRAGDVVALTGFGPGCIIPDGTYTVSAVNPDGSFHVGGNTAVWPSRIKQEKTMSTITGEVRQKYKGLKAQADAAYAAAEPQRQALLKAEKPWNELCGQIDDLLDGAEVETCEGCGEAIFPGDKSSGTDDGKLCAECSPSYRDVLQNPSHFMNTEGDAMTAEEAKEFVDAHIAGGGSLDDSMAR